MSSLIENILQGADVRKPTALVHFKRDIGFVAQKLLTLIVLSVQENSPEEDGFYFIPKRFFHHMLGWTTGKNYPLIYAGIDELYEHSLEWNFLGADKTFDKLKARLIISYASPSKTGEFIAIKLNPDIEKIIKDPRVFARYKVIMMTLLSDQKYTYALYELIADAHSRKVSDLIIPIDEMRSYLGIGDEQYKAFPDLRKRVLDPAIDEMNKKSDFHVSYSPNKVGRSYRSITFTFNQQAWQVPLFDEKLETLVKYVRAEHGNVLPSAPAEIDQRVYRYIQTQGLDKEANSYASNPEYTMELVVACFEAATQYIQRLESNHTPYNEKAIYRKALSDKWGSESVLKLEKKVLQEEEDARREEEEAAKQAASNRRSQMMDEYIESLDDSEREGLVGEFRAELEGQKGVMSRSLLKHLDREGLEHPSVRASFKAFLGASRPEA